MPKETQIPKKMPKGKAMVSSKAGQVAPAKKQLRKERTKR